MAVSVNNYAIAQDDPATPLPDDEPDAPIDGGASILVAAGVAYGLKKVYDKRKQNKDSEVA